MLGACTRFDNPVVEKGTSETTETARLVSARLERQTFLSLQGGEGDDSGWMLVRYEFHGPDRLSIHLENGEVEEKKLLETVRITASSDELRQAVLGYGSVMFNPAPLLELTRQ